MLAIYIGSCDDADVVETRETEMKIIKARTIDGTQFWNRDGFWSGARFDASRDCTEADLEQVKKDCDEINNSPNTEPYNGVYSPELVELTQEQAERDDRAKAEYENDMEDEYGEE